MRHDFLFHIYRVPIIIRQLPSGDFVVWHPFNEDIRLIVEPICRGHGYWREEYNNWIVYRRFANDVIESLRAAGDSHG